MRYLLLLIFAFLLHRSKAQSFELIRNADSPDSSFYDIFRLSRSEYWLAGENGVLYRMNAGGALKAVAYPSLGLDILKIDTLSDGQLVLAAEKGTLYFYNREKRTWRVEQLAGFEDKVFYEMASGPGRELFICGGSSKIAASRARMPKGFIIRSEDGGRTWETLYSNPFAMVWDVDLVEGKLIASIYNPLSRRRLISLREDGKWKAELKKGSMLFHQYDEENALLAGTRHILYRPEAVAGRVDAEMHAVPGTDMCWSVKRSGRWVVSLASAGMVELDDGRRRKRFKVSNFNLYEMERSPDGGFFIVGSHGLLLRMRLGERKMLANEEDFGRKWKDINSN